MPQFKGTLMNITPAGSGSSSLETSPLKDKNTETPGLSDQLSKLFTPIHAEAPVNAKRKISFDFENAPPSPLLSAAKKVEEVVSERDPLRPMARPGEAGSGVYVVEALESAYIFKPGAEKAEKAIACYEIAKAIGMEKSILESTILRAPHIMAEHVGLEGTPIDYTLIEIEGKPYLIDPYHVLSFSERVIDKRRLVLIEGTEFELKDGRLLPYNDPIDACDELPLKLVFDEDSNAFLVPVEKLQTEYSSLHFKTQDGKWAPFRQAYYIGQDTEDVAVNVPMRIHTPESIYDVADDEDEDGMFTLLTPEENERESKLEKITENRVVIAICDGEERLVNLAHCMAIEDIETTPRVGRSLLKQSGGSQDMESSDDEKGRASPIPNPANLVTQDIGYMQQKIPHLDSWYNGKEVNITIDTPERAAYFDMVDFNSFADAFILGVLLKMEDGKATTLQETNFLVSENAKGDKLLLTAIDLDETLGIAKDNPDIAPIRLGLMGYPQAYKSLTEEERAHILSRLQRVAESDLASILTSGRFEHLKDEQVVQSFQAIIENITHFYNEFQEKPFTLEDLAFSVYPAYKMAWDEMQALGLSRETIATHLGRDTLQEVKTLYNK